MKFSDGIPKRSAIAENITNEYKTKTCSECVRFEKRTHRKSGYHCCMKDFDIDVFPEDNAYTSRTPKIDVRNYGRYTQKKNL